jgi:XTP/dITP diphosphohydrolase
LIRLECATGNPGKLREFRLAAGLAPVDIELLPGFKQLEPCVEDGATFEENAVLKALYYGSHTSALLFADDSGLEVDALDGAPGVYSARFSLMHAPVAGPELPVDEANNRLLLEKLRGVENRSARFVCAIALAEGGVLRGVWRAAVEGEILHEARGKGGFGYDPLFYCPQVGSSFGEASNDQKVAVSHRGQALRKMIEAIGTLL